MAKPVGVATAWRTFELEPILPLAFSVDSPAGREFCGRFGVRLDDLLVGRGVPRRDLGSDI